MLAIDIISSSTSFPQNRERGSMMIEQRINIYNGIHKGLRAYMGDTLSRIARTDGSDQEDFGGGLRQVRELLAFMRSHLEHERDCVHPALHAMQPGAHHDTEFDHEHHEWAMSRLLSLCDHIEHCPASARDAQLEHLQRELSVFIGENLVHMNMEETENNAVLWKHYSDAQLMVIHQTILQSIGPQEMALGMRWIIPSLTPNELAAQMLDMRAGMPPAAFAGVLEMTRTLLADREWQKLQRALAAPRQMAA
jgi:hypothetical protein